MSTVSQGNLYKKKSKDWFIKKGYDCEYLEIYIRKGRFYAKRDLFGSDGMAMNGNEIIFWNSKSTENIGKRRNEFIKKANEEFGRFRFPTGVRRQLLLWPLGAKEPEIIECQN
jgi:hypothetical protein